MVFETAVLDEAAMLDLAAIAAHTLECRGVVYLDGPLGAGKTTFARGMLRAYDYGGAVKSPTFTLVEPYDLQWGQVYHFDLYRLTDPGELEYVGVDDYFSGTALCLVEWAERGSGFVPEADLMVHFRVCPAGRQLVLESRSETGVRVCDAVRAAVP